MKTINKVEFIREYIKDNNININRDRDIDYVYIINYFIYNKGFDLSKDFTEEFIKDFFNNYLFNENYEGTFIKNKNLNSENYSIEEFIKDIENFYFIQFIDDITSKVCRELSVLDNIFEGNLHIRNISYLEDRLFSKYSDLFNNILGDLIYHLKCERDKNNLNINK
ncbi:MAG: hypothetical protein PHV23_05300 [Candidatus Gracilibacteria bacterium]|nr:hypothetical protein [Candidatus Gracilibacteria bacterium]